MQRLQLFLKDKLTVSPPGVHPAGHTVCVCVCVCVCACVCACVLVSSCQATKVLISKYLATRRVVVSVGGVNGSERHCLQF